jgi:hypothetical protein
VVVGRRRARAADDLDMYHRATALLAAWVGFQAASLFLHLVFPLFFYMLVALSAAVGTYGSWRRPERLVEAPSASLADVH